MSSLVLRGQVCVDRDVGGLWVLVELSGLEAVVRAEEEAQVSTLCPWFVLTHPGQGTQSLLDRRPASSSLVATAGPEQDFTRPISRCTVAGALHWEDCVPEEGGGSWEDPAAGPVHCTTPLLLLPVPPGDNYSEAYCVETDTGKPEMQGPGQGHGQSDFK